jgi:hypothetical protein
MDQIQLPFLWFSVNCSESIVDALYHNPSGRLSWSTRTGHPALYFYSFISNLFLPTSEIPWFTAVQNTLKLSLSLSQSSKIKIDPESLRPESQGWVDGGAPAEARGVLRAAVKPHDLQQRRSGPESGAPWAVAGQLVGLVPNHPPNTDCRRASYPLHRWEKQAFPSDTAPRPASREPRKAAGRGSLVGTVEGSAREMRGL